MGGMGRNIVGRPEPVALCSESVGTGRNGADSGRNETESGRSGSEPAGISSNWVETGRHGSGSDRDRSELVGRGLTLVCSCQYLVAMDWNVWQSEFVSKLIPLYLLNTFYSCVYHFDFQFTHF